MSSKRLLMFPTKKQLIKLIQKLPWAEIIYGYDHFGVCININGYDEDKDTFTGYDNNCKFVELKFEELPTTLHKSW